jgi:hypothetical protein
VSRALTKLSLIQASLLLGLHTTTTQYKLTKHWKSDKSGEAVLELHVNFDIELN